MTCITEIAKMVASETPVESACNALISIAARAAGYEPVMRRSQISKVCMYHDNLKSACTASAAPKHQTYIVC